MEMDEYSIGGDSGAEEDEDDNSTHGSRSNSSSSSMSASSTTESDEDSAEEHDTSSSESHNSEDEDENENTEYMVKSENPNTLRWETCIAANTKVKLPQDLCEHFSIFKELLDYPRFWNECLTANQRETLCNLLPSFPKDCNVEAEKQRSLQMLFNRENERFGMTTLNMFHNHLSAGYYRPDIRRMCSLVRKAQKKKLLFEERKRSYELASQLLKSRESLLSSAYKQGFNQPVNRAVSKLHWRKPKPAIVEEKTQLRYLEELNAVRAEIGADTRLAADTTSENEENYPHYQTVGTKQKKKRRSMSFQGLSVRGLQLSHDDETIRPVFSTLHRVDYSSSRSFIREQTEETYRAMLIAHKRRRARRDVHPELNTQGIALVDLTQRLQIGQKHKLSVGTSVKITPAKKKTKLEQNPSCSPAIRVTTSNSIKHESDNSDYSHATDDNRHLHVADVDYKISTSIKSEPVDAYEMHHLAKKKMNPVTPKNIISTIINTSEIKKEIEDVEYNEIKTELNANINEDVLVETEEDDGSECKKELDLDSIDMMQIPIQLDDGIDILDDVKCENEGVISISDKELAAPCNDDIVDVNNGAELMQETHACFFSLLRDAFTSKGEYRMSAAEMKEAVTQWQGNPISPLNDWYSMAPSWPTLVPLALGFLAGELTYSQELDQRQERDQELVPYLENKGRGIYAWIGAGRDSDTRLSDLCTKFLMYKDSLTSPHTSASATATKSQIQFTLSNNNNTNHNAIGSGNSNGRSGSPISETVSIDTTGTAGSVTEWEPPKALFPTEWKVRSSTAEEREEFRRQERMRYAAPHKAFTYRMHGYASVVGPVKGIYQYNVGSGPTKPRGHSLLVADRPNFVTILALVRDATARLPNGEGTRADICQLLKDSQYIREQGDNDDKEGYLHSVVSGALDRLHYEADPCVRYYPRRKEWLYLHRARSESEFEMYHQQLQGIAKNKKNVGNTSRNKSLQPILKSTNINKEQSTNTKEGILKKEKRTTIPTQAAVSKKEHRKTEERSVNEHPIHTEQSVIANVAETAVSTITTSTISIPETTVSAVVSLANSSALVTGMTTDNVAVAVEPKSQPIATTSVKKTSNVVGKPVAVVKTNATQSLLQSNQHNFPHHQIQVSTSAGLQTIRLSGHSVLHSAQPVPVNSSSNVANGSANLTTIFPSTKTQNQQQQQQQPTIVTNQAGKSILQTANIKQQQPQQQHVLPGKTLLASQIKLVSSSQIKSLLTSHGLQGQTIFIKQSSPSNNQSQQQQQQQQLKQQQLQQQQLQQRVVVSQQQPIQTPGMQRIIAQIGGKPIAVQIQQSPHQQQQQKILAKVLTNNSGGQIISVESLLAQKGLKLATTVGHANQLNRQNKQVIQAQYQVMPQPQASSCQSKIIVSTQHQQSQTQQAQTVRMVTAQLAGKPIVLASGNKNVGVAVSASSGNVVLGKQSSSQQQQQQQQTQPPIILPSQLLNIKTLHGLKVIPTPTGLKTTSGAVYARVIAPTTISSTQSPSSQQTLQTQSSRNSSYGTP